jgi:hypothetical protein
MVEMVEMVEMVAVMNDLLYNIMFVYTTQYYLNGT